MPFVKVKPITSYTKNVAKSFGYVLQDMAKSYAPNISSMIKETNETTKEVYSSVKEWTKISNSEMEFSKGGFKSAANMIWKNTVSDFKSGKWYNKDRVEAFENDMMKGVFGDFDFDDIDFDNWGDDEDEEDAGWDEKDTAKVVQSESQKSTAILSARMDQVGFKVSNAVNKGTIESANYIVESSRANTNAILKMTESGFNTITKALMNVNNSVVGFAQLGEPLSIHIQNSAQFYTSTTEQLNKINEGIQKIVANTTVPEAKKTSSSSNAYENIFFDGKLDIGAWKDMIKSNFSQDKEMLELVTNMVKGIDPKNISLGTLMTKSMTHILIPKMLKDSVKGLDETVKYAVHDLFFKGKRKLENDGGLIGAVLSNYIFPDMNVKTSVNPSKYEKGKVSWDGYARQSLVHVIPTYLAQISSALGNQETRYNFETGKFETVNNIAKREEDRKKKYIEEAGGDFLKDFKAKAREIAPTPAEYDKLEKDISDYIWKCIQKGGEISFNDYLNNITGPNKKITLRRPDLVASIFYQLRRRYEQSGALTMIKMNYKTTSTAARMTRDYATREANGMDASTSLVDNSLLNSKKNVEYGARFTIEDLFKPDEHKNTLMDYMYGIYTILSYGGPSGRRRKRGGNGPIGPGPNIHPNNIDKYIEHEYEDEKKEGPEKYKDTDYTMDASGVSKYANDKIKEKLNKYGLGFLADLSPFKALSGMIDTMSKTITDVVWGKNGEPDKGIFGNFKAKMDDWFDGLKNKFDNKWDKISKKLFGEKDENGNYTGGFMSSFINDTKSNLKGAANWASSTFYDIAHGSKETRVKNAADNIRAKAEANRNINPDLIERMAARAAKNEAEKGKIFKGSGSGLPLYVGGDSGMFDEGLFGILKQAWGSVKGGATNIASKIFGSAKDSDIAQKIMGDKMKEVFGEAKDNAGALGAGALIGGGVSLLTGAVVGPLFGAAIGSAVGLTIKSKKIQNLLFGDFEVDEEGNKTDERSGGLLNKELSNFMTKNLPGMAKGAVVGGTAGLFLGSPLLGAIIGSGISYISSSEAAKEYLFGEFEVDENGKSTGIRKGGVFSKKVQQTVKKAVPNMAAGAIGGLIALGPVGLFVGAGAGYLATSQDFRAKMLGGEDSQGETHEGLFPELRTKIFDPLTELFANTSKAVSGWLRNTGKRLAGLLYKGATKIVAPLGKGILGIAGKMAGANGPIGAIGRGIMNISSNGLTGLANWSKNRNIKKGYGVYSKEEGRDLYANEILDLDSQTNSGMNYQQRSLYEMVGKAQNKDQLRAMRKAMAALDRNKYFGTAIDADSINLLGEAGLDIFDKDHKLDRTKLKNLNTTGAIDTISREMKNLTPEEEANRKLNDINDAVRILTKKILTGKVDEGEISRATGGLASGNEGIVQVNQYGDPIKYTADNEPDTSDPRTKNSLKFMNKFKEAIYGLPVLGPAIKGIGSVLGFFKEKLFGDKDKDKKGLFGKLFDVLGGKVKSVFSGFMEFLTGNPISIAIKGLTKGLTLGNVLTGIVAPALFTAAFFGKFDNMFAGLASKIPALAGNSPEGTSPVDDNRGAETADGTAIQLDESGNPVTDENGNYVSTDGKTVSSNTSVKFYGSDTRLGTQIKRNLINGALRGRGSTLTIVKNITSRGWHKAAKSGNKVAEAAVKNADNLATRVGRAASYGGVEGATKALTRGVSSKIDDALMFFPKIINKIPFLPSSIKTHADDIAKLLSQHIDDVLRTSGKKVGAVLGKIADFIPALNVAYSIGRGINAWGDAESILGITQKATIEQRCIATFLAVVNSLIPFIGDLIPDKVLVNIFMKILPMIGFDVSALEAQREAAQKEVEEYNKLNNTNLDIESYNQNVKKYGGIFTKAGNLFKDTVQNVTTAVKNNKANTVDPTSVADPYAAATMYNTGNDNKGKGKKDSNPLFENITKSFNSIGESISNSWNQFKEGFKLGRDKIKQEISYGEELFRSGDFTWDKYFAVKDEDPNNPASPLTKAFIIGNRFVGVPVVLIKYLGFSIKKTFNGIVDKVKGDISMLKRGMEATHKLAEEGKLDEFLDQAADVTKDSPTGFIFSAMATGYKFLNIIPASLHFVGNKIGGFFSNISDKVKTSYATFKKNLDITKEVVKEGRVGDLLNYGAEQNDGTVIGGLFSAMSFGYNYLNAVPCTLNFIGSKIHGFFADIGDKATKSYSLFKSGTDLIVKLAKDGKLDNLLAYEAKVHEDNPLGTVFSGLLTGYKFLNIIPTGLKFAGDQIKTFFGNIKDDINNDGKMLDASIKEMEELSKQGKTSEIMLKEAPKFKSLIGGFYNFRFGVSQMINTITGGLHNMFGFVGNLFEKFKSSVHSSDNWQEFVESEYGEDAGSGSGIAAGSSGFVSQLDPRYAGNRLGNSTVGAKGCGPAVASMVSGMPMNNAVNAAKGYQTTGGTDIRYFGDVLGRQGIPTRYIDRSQVMSALGAGGSGTQVILAGQDPYNTSKAFSPFGPNPHYVVASGTDRNGNIIIKDPELGRPRAYSPNILNSVQYSMAAGRSGLYSAGGSANWSHIWSFLKSKGLSDLEIVGFMGCWEQESGNTADSMEGNYLFKMNTREVMTDPVKANDYAVNKLFPATRKNVPNLNTSAYKIGNYYYPGYGLAAWTGPRLKSLMDWCKANNKDFTKLDSQLEFMYYEYKKNTKLQEALKAAKNTKESVGAVLDHYEMYPGWKSKTSSTRSWWDTRTNHANKILKQLAGSSAEQFIVDTGTYQGGDNYGDSITGDIGDSATNTETGSAAPEKLTLSGLIGAVSSLFSNIFNPQQESSNTGENSDTDRYGNYTDQEIDPNAKSAMTNSPGDIMKSILGKINYSMNGPRNPEKGSADCSSTVQWAIKKAGGPDIGGNTGAMYNNSNLTPIAYNGGRPFSSIPNEAQKDDVLFFARHGSSDKGSALDHVGHVGIYLGDNKYIDHGGPGKGTVIKNGPGTELIKISRVTGGFGEGSPMDLSYDIDNNYYGEYADYVPSGTKYNSSSVSASNSKNKVMNAGNGKWTGKNGKLYDTREAAERSFNSVMNAGNGKWSGKDGKLFNTKSAAEESYIQKPMKSYGGKWTGKNGKLYDTYDAAARSLGLSTSSNKSTASKQADAKAKSTNPADLADPYADATMYNASGSGLAPYNYASSVLNNFNAPKYAAAGSGLTGIKYYGGASGVTSASVSNVGSFKATIAANDTYVSPSSIPGDVIDAKLLKLLFESITVILKNVSDNTVPVKGILELLQQYLPGKSISEEDAAKIANTAAGTAAIVSTSSNNKANEDVSAQFKSFVQQLADIAKG